MISIETNVLRSCYAAFLADPSAENIEDVMAVLSHVRQPDFHLDFEKGQLMQHVANHEAALEARTHLHEARKLLEKLKEPPRFPATLVQWQPRNGTPERAVVHYRGGLVEVGVISSEVMETLEVGHEVILNHDSTCILENRGQFPTRGEVVTFERWLPDGRMLLVRTPDTHIIAEAVRGLDPKPGDDCLVNDAGICLEVLPRKEAKAPRSGPVVRFSDIGGLDEQIAKLERLFLWPLRYPEESKRYGQSTPKGVILIGQPGTGKTMMVKALATALCEFNGLDTSAGNVDPGRHFLSVKASDIRSKWYGDSEKAVAGLIAEARSLSQETGVPTVIYIDEIEGLLRNRESDTTTNAVSTDVLLQFLTELDGMDTCEGKVVLVGSTNKMSHLDPAISRAGRIDHIITFSRPNRSAARAIFEVHFAKSVPYLAEKESASAAADALIEAALGRIYATNGPDNILAEIMFADGTKRQIRAYELFNGAEVREIVKRAAARPYERVIEAGQLYAQFSATRLLANTTAEIEWEQCADPDITIDDLFAAIDGRFAEMCEPLSAENVKSYITLRDDVRVVSLEKMFPKALGSKYRTHQ